MSNDTSTLTGALSELGETIAANLVTKGVTGATASDGLTTLAGKILNVPSGGGATNIVQGTFTTGSSGGSTGTVSLNYTGSGYPILAVIWVDGGVYNNGTGGNTTWYNSTSRYDAGLVLLSKSRTNVAPSYGSSGDDNTAAIAYIYKNSTSSATTYGWAGVMNNNSYVDSSTNASANNNMIRFKGNGKTLAYYIGNRGSSSRGLVRNTKFSYIVIYSS